MTKATRLKIGLMQLAGTAALISVSASAQVTWETHGHLVDDQQSKTAQESPAESNPAPQNQAAKQPVISCFNAQSLKLSLDQMIAPMSRAEQKSFVTGFFH